MSRINWPSVPSSWAITELGQIATVVMGQSPPGNSYNQEKNGLPFFQGKTDFRELFPKPATWCTKPSRIAETGDILISVRAPVGPTNIAQEKSCIGRGLAAIRPDQICLERDYLLYYLRFAEAAIASLGQGSTFEAINKSDLFNLRVAFPPIPEQQHIVGIFKQADALRRQRRVILEQANLLPTALFLEMFGDPITNQNGYREKLLSALGDLDRGISKHRPRDAEFLFGGKYPFIQTGDVTNSGGWISSYSQTYSEAGLAQSRLRPAGTLCITIAANIAKTGLLEFDACFPDSVVGFKTGDDVTSEYVMFAINLWQSVLEAQAPQAAQKNINLKVLRGLRIPVPPKPEQDQFTAFVREFREASVEQAAVLEDIETFGHQLYVKAFSGMLTGTWRESHHDELESWVLDHPECVPKISTRVVFKESAPPERAEPARPTRRWLMDQLGEVQANVYWALREWKGTLIPSEDLDRFLEEWPIGHLEDAHDHVLRALYQLAGLGFIARVSVPNQAGEYVTGYRVLREDELTKTDDLARLGAAV